MESPLQSEDDAAGAAATPVEDNKNSIANRCGIGHTVVITASVLSLLVSPPSPTKRIANPSHGRGSLVPRSDWKDPRDDRRALPARSIDGYLTANPGCFPALMSASTQQRPDHPSPWYWRPKSMCGVNPMDSWSVYPFTNQLHPNMPEDELPVPPLSPAQQSAGKDLNARSRWRAGSIPTS